MAGSVGNQSGSGLKAEINVTPLVDVVLVLLIIFMVVTPMLTRGKNVQLPIAAAADAKAESAAIESVVLTITADKRVWLETTRVKDDAELVKEVKAHLAENPGVEILIKADSSVSVRDLRPVLQKLKAAGATQIAFAVLEQARGAK